MSQNYNLKLRRPPHLSFVAESFKLIIFFTKNLTKIVDIVFTILKFGNVDKYENKFPERHYDRNKNVLLQVNVLNLLELKSYLLVATNMY